MQSVCETMAPLVHGSVEIINEVPEDLPQIQGDGGRLIQVFTNLIGNSAKVCLLVCVRALCI